VSTLALMSNPNCWGVFVSGLCWIQVRAAHISMRVPDYIRESDSHPSSSMFLVVLLCLDSNILLVRPGLSCLWLRETEER
jgi:hypothetical protein